MTDPDLRVQPRRRRWLMPLLFASLALNLLIVGIVIGAVSQRDERVARVDGPARSLLGEPFVRALDVPDRRALGREILRNRERLRENRSDLRQRVESLLQELRQETFDRKAVSELLAEQRRLAIARQEVGERLLLDRLEDMSTEERRAYADRLSEALRSIRRN